MGEAYLQRRFIFLLCEEHTHCLAQQYYTGETKLKQSTQVSTHKIVSKSPFLWEGEVAEENLTQSQKRRTGRTLK